MATTIQLRRGTAEFWESENPVLFPGEMGVEMHKGEPCAFKVGDGETPWKELPYSPNAPGEGGGGPGGGGEDIPDLVLFYNNGKV